MDIREAAEAAVNLWLLSTAKSQPNLSHFDIRRRRCLPVRHSACQMSHANALDLLSASPHLHIHQDYINIEAGVMQTSVYTQHRCQSHYCAQDDRHQTAGLTARWAAHLPHVPPGHTHGQSATSSMCMYDIHAPFQPGSIIDFSPSCTKFYHLVTEACEWVACPESLCDNRITDIEPETLWQQDYCPNHYNTMTQ